MAISLVLASLEAMAPRRLLCLSLDVTGDSRMGFWCAYFPVAALALSRRLRGRLLNSALVRNPSFSLLSSRASCALVLDGNRISNGRRWSFCPACLDVMPELALARVVSPSGVARLAVEVGQSSAVGRSTSPTVSINAREETSIKVCRKCQRDTKPKPQGYIRAYWVLQTCSRLRLH